MLEEISRHITWRPLYRGYNSCIYHNYKHRKSVTKSTIANGITTDKKLIDIILLDIYDYIVNNAVAY